MGPHRPHTSLNDMGGELPYSSTSRLNHTIDYLITLHRLTPARSLSQGLGRARSYNKVCHVTESRAIASRCPKLRRSKGHLVYKRPPARSQLRYRTPH